MIVHTMKRLNSSTEQIQDSLVVSESLVMLVFGVKFILRKFVRSFFI